MPILVPSRPLPAPFVLDFPAHPPLRWSPSFLIVTQPALHPALILPSRSHPFPLNPVCTSSSSHSGFHLGTKHWAQAEYSWDGTPTLSLPLPPSQTRYRTSPQFCEYVFLQHFSISCKLLNIQTTYCVRHGSSSWRISNWQNMPWMDIVVILMSSYLWTCLYNLLSAGSAAWVRFVKMRHNGAVQ